MDLTIFFRELRAGVFRGRMSQSQVEGVSAILDGWALYGSALRAHLAYVLATSYHETGGRMQPVREGFAKSDKAARAAVARLYAQGRISTNYAAPVDGKSYYGRGHVQLTWRANYKLMGEILGIDLVKQPDLALEPAVSVRILIEGMLDGASNRGDFTGKALEDYIDERRCDFPNARRVVNGMDKADLIAGYAKEFEGALAAAGYTAGSSDAVSPRAEPAGSTVPIPPRRPERDEIEVDGTALPKSTTVWTAIGQFATTAITSLGALDWKVAVPIILLSAGLAVWIIRERKLKSYLQGV